MADLVEHATVTPAREASNAPTRVSTLELFFDLVFVFTITQLTSVLQTRPTCADSFRSSSCCRDLVDVRRLRLAHQCRRGGSHEPPAAAARRHGELPRARARHPHAFSGSGTAFGLAYLAIVLVHATLFTRSSSEGVVRAILGLAPFNIATALLVLVAGIAGGTAEYVLSERPSRSSGSRPV